MSDEQLFDPDQTEIVGEEVKEESERTAEEVDPRLVTDKAKTGHTIRCRNLAEKLELRDAIDKFKVSRGKANVGDVIPAITSLIEAETGEAPTAISSNVEAVADGLDLIRKSVAAISAAFATTEQREAAKAQDTITDQANEIAELRRQLEEKRSELVQVRGERARLDSDLERSEAAVERLQREVADWKDRDEINRNAVKVLASTLAMPPEQQAGLLQELMGWED